MQYRTELHCHTSEVSCCAHVPAEQVVEEYIRAGYQTVVITDHLNGATESRFQTDSWETFTEQYLAGYHAAKRAAKGRLHVLLGMELTFNENANDYLVFGMTEEFIRSHAHMRQLGLAKFGRLARREGLLVYQAHPFRNTMTVMDPALLDGIEVYNANVRHDSRNAIAMQWADSYGLLRSSGSDYHQPEDVGRGGIVTDEVISDNKTLLRMLQNQPTLIASNT